MNHPHPGLPYPTKLAKKTLRIVALGGLGEIGRNMTVFEIDSQILVVDCGADHRLTEPADWADYYGGDYSTAWTYGMPELADQRGQADGRRGAAGRRGGGGSNFAGVAHRVRPGVG